MAPSEVLGVALAGGSGVRARPLTLKATNYIRSKATVRFLGRRVIDWELLSFKAQGIVNFLVLAKGKANRYQIKGQVGYGEGLASTSGAPRGLSTRRIAVRRRHRNGTLDAEARAQSEVVCRALRLTRRGGSPAPTLPRRPHRASKAACSCQLGRTQAPTASRSHKIP